MMPTFASLTAPDFIIQALVSPVTTQLVLYIMLWQPAVLLLMIKLASWQLSIFGESNEKANGLHAAALHMVNDKTYDFQKVFQENPFQILSAKWWLYHIYRQVSIIRRTLEGNKIVDHSDVIGASPVGAAPTTSSFST